MASGFSQTHLYQQSHGRVQLGYTIKAPFTTPIGKLSLTICYDLRFPEILLSLVDRGLDAEYSISIHCRYR